MAYNFVSVKHNFETAHRLYFLGGKCQNLHGHSWQVEITFRGVTTPEGIIGDFGSLKKVIRQWIDDRLDHGTMLGVEDPLLPAMVEDGGKLFVFGRDWMGGKWPTVEMVATMLARVSKNLVPDLEVFEVVVQETAVNKAIWRAS